MAFSPWRNVPGRVLLIMLNLFTGVGLIFEGYNQGMLAIFSFLHVRIQAHRSAGVMGTASNTPGFIEMAKIGSDGVITNPTKQG
jgi:hypothetical protein